MAFLKRSTKERKLISTEDPSIALHDEDNIIEYVKTFDIAKLGSLPELLEIHTVFTVKPLMPKYEAFVDGLESNWWAIFKYHVTNVENFRDEDGKEVVIPRDKEVLAEEARDLFPQCVVEDVGKMIVSLANNDGLGKPHSTRAGFTAELRRWQIHRADEKRARDARLGAAKSNS